MRASPLFFLSFLPLLTIAGAQQEKPKIVKEDVLVQTLEKKPEPAKPEPAGGKTRGWGGGKDRKMVVGEAVSVTTQAILFKFGTTELDGADSMSQVGEIGRALSNARLQGAVFEIEGHTDNVGDDKSNQSLSEQRAKAIVEMLIGLYKVPPQNLKPVGKGEAEPVAGSKDVQSDSQRAVNRRVVLKRVE